MTHTHTTLLALIAASLLGCAADGAKLSNEDRGEVQCAGANDCPPGYFCNAFGFCARPGGSATDAGVRGDGTAPEVEERVDPPQSGKRFVYVAITAQDTVVRIEASSLRVEATKVGPAPTSLRTLSGRDVALVLNRGADRVTIIRSPETGDGPDVLKTLPVARGLNQLALSPDGAHAVAFFDVALSAGQIAGHQTLQEVTVLRLAAGKEQAVGYSVGFRPTGVQFSADGTRAFVITEAGISTIALSGELTPAARPPLSYYKDPLLEPAPAEVIVASSGDYALLRQVKLLGLRVLNLQSGAITDLPLGSEPSDLDVTPDGKLALVVLRQSSELVLVDLPADLADPSGVERLALGGPAVGQIAVTADGARALLYTNATNLKLLVVADLQKRAVKTYALQKGVRAVRLAPDGKTALVVHNKLPGTPSPSDPPDVYFDKRHGYSAIELAAGFAKLQLTEADPGASVFSSNGNTGYVLVGDRAQNVRLVDVVDLRSLLVRSVTLGSHPVALGLVPATQQVYIAQSHALGRVTFIDATGTVRTLTGFALNSQIVE